MPASCPPLSPACPLMCRCACPAPRCVPAVPTPGHTSHSGSNKEEKVKGFEEDSETK